VTTNLEGVEGKRDKVRTSIVCAPPLLRPESDPCLLALFDSLVMGRSSAPPEPPRAPPDKHIVGGLLQARILWDDRQEEELDEDWQEEDVKVSQKLSCIQIVGPSLECTHCC
jgi:hypothetical protein